MSTDKHGKSSKQGRQKKSGQNLKYINENRHVKGHLRRIKRHLKAQPEDAPAQEALKAWGKKLGTRFG